MAVLVNLAGHSKCSELLVVVKQWLVVSMWDQSG